MSATVSETQLNNWAKLLGYASYKEFRDTDPDAVAQFHVGNTVQASFPAIAVLLGQKFNAYKMPVPEDLQKFLGTWDVQPSSGGGLAVVGGLFIGGLALAKLMSKKG